MNDPERESALWAKIKELGHIREMIGLVNGTYGDPRKYLDQRFEVEREILSLIFLRKLS